jgi:hypothetical protein
VTHPDGQYFTYSYDAASNPRDIYENGTTRISEITYHAADNRRALNRRATSLYDIYNYDTVGRVDMLRFYDPALANTVAFNFTYNPANQINSHATSNDSYVYNGDVNVDRAYTVNGLNQFLTAGPAAFGYDANGNLTGDGTTSYVYDIENRLVSAAQASGGATTATLRYDPLGRRGTSRASSMMAMRWWRSIIPTVRSRTAMCMASGQIRPMSGTKAARSSPPPAAICLPTGRAAYRW